MESENPSAIVERVLTPVGDYRVEQVKSLLDQQTNLHETTSMSRQDDYDDINNHGSVQQPIGIDNP